MILPRLRRRSSPAPIYDAVDDWLSQTAAEALRRDGFVAVERLFSATEVQAVQTLLDRAFERAMRMPAANALLVCYPADAPGGWDQIELNYAATLAPALLQTAVFRRCTTLARRLAGPGSHAFDHAIYKAAHNRTETPWHQDAAFRRWQLPRPHQLHFWIPLQDVARDGGCMEFLPGSHRRPALRHETVLRASGRIGLVAAPDPAARVACPLSAGGLTIHTPATLHCARANASDVPRRAWVLQFGLFGETRLAAKRLAGSLVKLPVGRLRSRPERPA
ncbi:phytanoyl-CoA dioxygenase family protein [Sphingomonas sp. ac-8]|uniref:phytanoyl-CoA dioxygenase family protein n=1 Tax=Sphingomonas sp. ac-8 TaxID=3242977 RepID=UPI003A7FD1FE